MHIANDPEPAPTPLYMWRVLREYLGTLWPLFGRVWVHRDEARGMGDVLRPLEMMLRRLIFLDALDFDYVAAPIPVRAGAPRILAHSDRDSFTLDLDSEKNWRVSFNLRLESRAAPASLLNTSAMPAAQRARLPNAEFTASLALRAEALLRGFNDPAPLVQRMARLLARDGMRQYLMLADVNKRDRAKPFFHEVGLTIALAKEHFHAELMRWLNKPKRDSS